MTSTPKTIQIFLASGEPHGIRIAEIATGIVHNGWSECRNASRLTLLHL